MHIDQNTNKLVMDVRSCWSCDGTRKVNEWVKCEACKGTGKVSIRKRCMVCDPKGDHLHNSLIKGKKLSIGTAVCQSCTDGTQMENITDSADDIWKTLNFKVYRSNRHQTIGESLLGLGCAWSTTDYGRHKSETDEALIENTRNHSYIQACKFAQNDGTICDHVGIFCNDNGYSVKAVFVPTDATKIENLFRNGLSVDVGMQVGMNLANQGLNGTMIACKFGIEE